MLKDLFKKHERPSVFNLAPPMSPREEARHNLISALNRWDEKDKKTAKHFAKALVEMLNEQFELDGRIEVNIGVRDGLNGSYLDNRLKTVLSRADRGNSNSIT